MSTNNITNDLTVIHTKDNTISLSKILFLLYIAISSNYASNLMSKQLKDHIENNRITQHIIGIMTLYVLISHIGGISDIQITLKYTIITYLLFLFTTKLDLHFNMAILCCLFVWYLYENKINNNEYNINNDKLLTDVQKKTMINKNTEYKKYFVLSILLITVIGTTLYSSKKEVQYGGGFDIITYMLY